MTMAYVGLGEIDLARMVIERPRVRAPEYLAARLAGLHAIRDSEYRLRAETFLRIAAGLEDPRAAEALR